MNVRSLSDVRDRAVPPGTAGDPVAGGLSAREFGALGKGDDYTEELRAALHHARERGRQLFLPDGVYGVSAPLVDWGGPGGPWPFRIRGAGRGRTILETNVDGRAVFGGAAPQQRLGRVRADVTAGAGAIEIDPGHDVAPGDVLLLQDDTRSFRGGPRHEPIGAFGEVVRAHRIDGASRIELAGPLDDGYLADSTRCTRIDCVAGVAIEELTLRQQGDGSRHSRAISLSGTRRLQIRGVSFERFASDCVRLSHAVDFTVADCDFVDLSTAFGSQYGICLGPGCRSGLITGIRSVRGGKHLVTTYGDRPDRVGPSHILVSGCLACDGGTNVFDTHHNARNIVFQNCAVHNSFGAAFQVRGRDCSIIDPIVTTARYGIKVAFAGPGTMIRGGRLQRCETGVEVTSTDDVRIRDLVIDAPREYGVAIRRQTGYINVGQLDLSGVEVSGEPVEGAFAVDPRLDRRSWRLDRCRPAEAFAGPAAIWE